MWCDVTWRDVMWLDVRWDYCFNCMTLSTLSTITQRHITYSIYQCLPIHRRESITALYIASQEGKIEAVRLLLDRGADIEATSNVSHNTLYPTKSDTVWTPLFWMKSILLQFYWYHYCDDQSQSVINMLIISHYSLQWSTGLHCTLLFSTVTVTVTVIQCYNSIWCYVMSRDISGW